MAPGMAMEAVVVHPSFSCASQADASATSLHMWGRKGRNSHRCACLCCRKLFQRRHSSQTRQLLPVGVRIPSIFSARVDPTIGARFSGPSKKTRVLFFMLLTASHQTTGRQALQHTTDTHDRETARRPLGVWLECEKILRTPTGMLKGAENGTGLWDSR
jgi:hypothetical protein